MSTSSATVVQSASSTQLSSSSMPSSTSSSPVMNSDDSTNWSQSSATIQAYNSIDSSQTSPASSQLSAPIRYQTNLEGEVVPVSISASSATVSGGSVVHPAVAAAAAAAVEAASAAQFEPELKKIKLTHYQMDAKLSMAGGLGDPSQLSLDPNRGGLLIPQRRLEERIGGILCCTVCLDLPQTAIYQCTNGHLMCAGCLSHLLTDARLKDEQATCPNCRCEISKTSCYRNLAVEKTISELPANCIYCNVLYPRNSLDNHQRNECYERPTKCAYQKIGCTWEGPYHELDEHRAQCAHPKKPGSEIIGFLHEKEAEAEEIQQSYVSLVNLFSLEKICFNDLQFKQYKTDEITPKLYFETNRFNAFYHQWVLKARVNDNQKNPNLSLNRYFSYQLILKSKLSSTQSSLEVKFCILKGPFGEVYTNPTIQTFEFNQNKLETDYIKLNISSSDCNKLLSSKMINFRLFMFQA